LLLYLGTSAPDTKGSYIPVKKTVEPRTLKGFQDLLPAELLPRNTVIRAIEAIFLRYGFAPIETPALEYLDVLLGPGGEEVNKEIFGLKSPEDEAIGLRFDLTVPFSRIMAQYPDRIKTPFRRYAIGPVFRADKPGPGRFRQFTQFDVDIAGAPTVAADAEIIAIMAEVMQALGAPDFAAVINNRKLIDALLYGLGIDEEATHKHILRVIDKLQKVGESNIRLELGPGRIDDSGDPIPGVKLSDDKIDAIMTYIAVKGDTRNDVVEAVAKALPDSDASTQAVDEMRELAAALDALGVAEAHAIFDPSLARGLDYYTGPVFEMIIPSVPQFGSVMGGGRYDGLVSRFSNVAMACTGMSVGLDRLMAALIHLGAVSVETSPVQVLVVTLGKVPTAEVLRVATELRRAGYNTEVYYASKKKMKMGNQLSHADHYGIPVAVILGEDEVANGQVAIKDLIAGKTERETIEDREAYREAGKTGQVTVAREEMIATVRDILGA
jgi:histidyl-tRNA synthetase